MTSSSVILVALPFEYCLFLVEIVEIVLPPEETSWPFSSLLLFSSFLSFSRLTSFIIGIDSPPIEVESSRMLNKSLKH